MQEKKENKENHGTSNLISLLANKIDMKSYKCYLVTLAKDHLLLYYGPYCSR